MKKGRNQTAAAKPQPRHAQAEPFNRNFMRYLLLIGLALAVCACSQAEPSNPEKQVAVFFDNLKNSGPRIAVDNLIEGTLLKQQKGMQIEALVPQFEAALKIYGAVDRMEHVDEKKFGDSFVRFRLITYHTSDAPLFWQFIFFRGKAGWQVYVFSFNDQFSAVFKDV